MRKYFNILGGLMDDTWGKFRIDMFSIICRCSLFKAKGLVVNVVKQQEPIGTFRSLSNFYRPIYFRTENGRLNGGCWRASALEGMRRGMLSNTVSTRQTCNSEGSNGAR
jgi:hypothetical protein